MASNGSTPDAIPLDKWGRDHWSVFAYIETCIVDNGGVPDLRRMRTDVSLHPHMGPYEPVGAGRPIDGAEYPTRLRDGATAAPHDDWSCLDDAEAAGLLLNIHTGANRCYRLTDRGLAVAGSLRAHKARGGSFTTFRPVLSSEGAASSPATVPVEGVRGAKTAEENR